MAQHDGGEAGGEFLDAPAERIKNRIAHLTYCTDRLGSPVRGGRFTVPDSGTFFTSSPQNGESHFASTTNNLLGIYKATAAAITTRARDVGTATKSAEQYAAGEDVASMTFVFPSEQILAEEYDLHGKCTENAQQENKGKTC